MRPASNITTMTMTMIMTIDPKSSSIGSLAFALFALTATSVAAVQPHDLDPDAIASGRFGYVTVLQIGDTSMEIESVREIRIDAVDGAPRLLITTTSSTGMGETVDRLQLDAETLYPLAREIVQGLGRMTLDYDSERVTGLIQSVGESIRVDLNLEQPAYAGDAGLDTLLAALPLAVGLNGTLAVVETDVDAHVQQFRFSVAEPETISVPAGTFSTWPVRVQAQDDPDYQQTLWLTVELPRVFVQAEAPVPQEAGGGTLVTRLTETGNVTPESP